MWQALSQLLTERRLATLGGMLAVALAQALNLFSHKFGLDPTLEAKIPMFAHALSGAIVIGTGVFVNAHANVAAGAAQGEAHGAALAQGLTAASNSLESSLPAISPEAAEVISAVEDATKNQAAPDPTKSAKS